MVGAFSDGLTALKRSGATFAIPSKITGWLVRQVIGIERTNALLDSIVAEACGLMDENGIRCCLAKGQGAARNYTHPEHRSPGDIDLLLDGKIYRRAAELLCPRASEIFEENEPKKAFGNDLP